MFCERCQREVVVVTVSRGAAGAEELEALRAQHERAGRLVCFNPLPFEPLRCPGCRRELTGAERLHQPLPDEQYSDGAGADLDDLYRRADRITAGVEVAAQHLLGVDDASWRRALRMLGAVVEKLARECFHDGALGPGTGMLDPGPYLERIRSAFEFAEAIRELPSDLTARLAAVAALATTTGLPAVCLRAPDGWEATAAAAEVTGLAAVAAEHLADPAALTFEIGCDVAVDVAKWTGGGLPRLVGAGTRLRADGPPGLHQRVADALAG